MNNVIELKRDENLPNIYKEFIVEEIKKFKR